MTDKHINIKLTFEPYKKRQASVLKWTFLLYFIVAFVAGLSNNFGTGFFLTLIFLTFIFLLDYSRRLNWVKNIIDSLQTDTSGLKITYYEKDKLLSATIPWNKLTILTGTTFTKNLIKIITIKSGADKVASFYADNNIDNEKINELYKKLIELKSAYA